MLNFDKLIVQQSARSCQDKVPLKEERTKLHFSKIMDTNHRMEVNRLECFTMQRYRKRGIHK